MVIFEPSTIDALQKYGMKQGPYRIKQVRNYANNFGYLFLL
jgi:hypothetical protein